MSLGTIPTFPIGKNLVLSCLITGVYDVNRNTILTNQDDSLFQAWAKSLTQLGLQGILFHNDLPEEICSNSQNEHIHFIRVPYSIEFNPNVYRYFIYQQFLAGTPHEIENLFITDISDVVAVQNPFIHPFFNKNPNAIFCGDEPKLLDNEWMKEHSEHLRSTIRDFAWYEDNFRAATLLNCGIIGGSYNVMFDFINRLVSIHKNHNQNNHTAYTGDMGAFNYLVRTQFNDRVFHGPPVNTVFKEYQSDRNDCWFRHK